MSCKTVSKIKLIHYFHSHVIILNHCVLACMQIDLVMLPFLHPPNMHLLPLYFSKATCTINIIAAHPLLLPNTCMYMYTQGVLLRLKKCARCSGTRGSFHYDFVWERTSHLQIMMHLLISVCLWMNVAFTVYYVFNLNGLRNILS